MTALMVMGEACAASEISWVILESRSLRGGSGKERLNGTLGSLVASFVPLAASFFGGMALESRNERINVQFVAIAYTVWGGGMLYRDSAF